MPPEPTRTPARLMINCDDLSVPKTREELYGIISRARAQEASFFFYILSGTTGKIDFEAIAKHRNTHHVDDLKTASQLEQDFRARVYLSQWFDSDDENGTIRILSAEAHRVNLSKQSDLQADLICDYLARQSAVKDLMPERLAGMRTGEDLLEGFPPRMKGDILTGRDAEAGGSQDKAGHEEQF